MTGEPRDATAAAVEQLTATVLNLAAEVWAMKEERLMREALAGPDRKYVSQEDSTYLRLCRNGDDVYVGKVVEDRLTTDRIEDVRRNVLSIMRRLCPEVRLPTQLEIRVCVPGTPDASEHPALAPAPTRRF